MQFYVERTLNCTVFSAGYRGSCHQNPECSQCLLLNGCNIKELNLNSAEVIDELLSREKVAELLNQADVLLQPIGDFEKPHPGISSKLYEHQTVGKPIVCDSSGTAGYYISDTKSGIVVKPGD